MFEGLWQYRFFILSAIQNDQRSRFARSRLGALWMIINPLAQVAIYAVILSNVMAAKLPGITNKYGYAIYLMAGLLGWNLFNELITRCLTLFIEQGNLLKKMAFPPITLPAIAAGSCLLNNLMLFTAMFFLFVLLGHSFSWAMLYLLPLTLMVVALGLSIGLMLGIINVFLRDMGQVVPILLQLWFWFTPIVYPENIIPERFRQLLNLNPMYPISQAYHQVLVYGHAPSNHILFAIAFFTASLCALSLFMFKQASPEMADVL